MRPQILFVLAACVLVGCRSGRDSHEAANVPDKTLLLCTMSTNSNLSAPTLFWGTLQNPGNFIIGGHLQGGLTNVVASLRNAHIRNLAVESPPGASSELRKEIQRQLDAVEVSVTWFGRANGEDGERAVHTWVRKPQLGMFVLLSDTLTSRDGWFLGRFVGHDAVEVARRLSRAGINHVVFESAFKLMPETSSSVAASFAKEGVGFDHFWVPSSTQSSGVVDLRQADGSIQH